MLNRINNNYHLVEKHSTVRIVNIEQYGIGKVQQRMLQKQETIILLKIDFDAV